jgi:isopenicillin-N N-acyltransferase like protein
MTTPSNPTPAPAPPRRRLRRWILAALALVVGLPVAAVAVMLFLMWLWLAAPPPAPPDTPLFSMNPVREGTRTTLGRNWFETQDGLNVLYLAGTPYEMGYANGVLSRELVRAQEEHLLALVRSKIPNRAALFLVAFFVTWHNRNLPRHVAPDLQLEILGACRGSTDFHPELGPHYHRVLNYHAAHDISHLLIDSPLVSGCTSFGAWGAATPDGRLLAGRNFDWEAGDVFDRNRILILCEPDEGIPFVSLAWSGMVGAVSGMNRAGISVSINGIRGRPPGDTGTPVSLVVRDVLQHAATLDQAVGIIRGARVFVSELFLVGSRADGRFVVVEKTPETTAVREGADGLAVCANHFLTDALKGDPDNAAFMAEGPSVSRHGRARELLEGARGRITIPRAVEILRDRDLPGGRFPGNGHRGALNALIATHAVAMDLTDGIFWAGAPPHQLGAFRAFGVKDFRRRPELDAAEDPMVASGEFDRFRESRARLAEAERALRAGDAARALAAARQAETLNPGLYLNAWMEGRALLAAGRKGEVAAALERALKAGPASAPEAKELEEQLKAARQP